MSYPDATHADFRLATNRIHHKLCGGQVKSLGRGYFADDGWRCEKCRQEWADWRLAAWPAKNLADRFELRGTAPDPRTFVLVEDRDGAACFTRLATVAEAYEKGLKPASLD